MADKVLYLEALTTWIEPEKFEAMSVFPSVDTYGKPCFCLRLYAAGIMYSEYFTNEVVAFEKANEIAELINRENVIG